MRTRAFLAHSSATRSRNALITPCLIARSLCGIFFPANTTRIHCTRRTKSECCGHPSTWAILSCGRRFIRLACVVRAISTMVHPTAWTGQTDRGTAKIVRSSRIRETIRVSRQRLLHHRHRHHLCHRRRSSDHLNWQELVPTTNCRRLKQPSTECCRGGAAIQIHWQTYSKLLKLKRT